MAGRAGATEVSNYEAAAASLTTLIIMQAGAPKRQRANAACAVE